jgi:hypothetical protein
MDLSKYKASFDRLIGRGQRIRQDVYRNFLSNKDGTVPLISSSNQIYPMMNTQPLVSAPDTHITNNTTIASSNNQEDISIMEREARTLRDVLPSEVTEANIYDLLQRYNSADVALNAYFEGEINQRI